jgi:hypothetical protein
MIAAALMAAFGGARAPGKTRMTQAQAKRIAGRMRRGHRKNKPALDRALRNRRNKIARRSRAVNRASR